MKTTIFLLGLISTLPACTKPPEPPAPEPSALVKTAPAMSMSLVESITLYGQAELDPAAVQTLTADFEARVAAIHVALGQSVDQGQPVATVVASATTQLDLTRLAREADLAQREFERLTRLRADGLASDVEVAQARLTAQTARQSSSSLSARSRGGSVVLRAPSAGVVDALSANLGDLVAAGAPVARIGGLGSQRARLGGEVEDMVRLRPGQPVSLTSLRSDSRAYDGVVESLDRRVDPATRLAAVLVKLPGAAGFLPGEALRGRIVFGQRPAAIVIPRTALLYEGETPSVFVVSGDKAAKRSVRLGLESGDAIQVLQGVRAGDVLVIEGAAALSDGMRVRRASGARPGAVK